LPAMHQLAVELLELLAAGHPVWQCHSGSPSTPTLGMP
jgi:hypothetical protein